MFLKTKPAGLISWLQSLSLSFHGIRKLIFDKDRNKQAQLYLTREIVFLTLLPIIAEKAPNSFPFHLREMQGILSQVFCSQVSSGKTFVAKNDLKDNVENKGL